MKTSSGDVGTAGIWRAFIIKPNTDGTAYVYIPMLHRNMMPFVNPEDPTQGIHEGCEVNYPIANGSFWKYRPSYTVGDPVWVVFENNNTNYPIMVGNFATNVEEASAYVPDGFSDGSMDGLLSGELSGTGASIKIPDQYGTVETYEKELINKNDAEDHGWAASSPQGKLRKSAISSGRQRQGSIFGLTNCAIIDNRLEIATTPNIGGQFPVTIGDYLDVEFANGVVWNCILADIKGADAGNVWGHNNGKSVVEIIYWDYTNNSGNQHLKVSKITKVGNYNTGVSSPVSSSNASANDRQKKVVEKAKTTKGEQGYCQVYVKNVYNNAGFGLHTRGSAKLAEAAWSVSTNLSNIPIGATVYAKVDPSSNWAGHVGIYIGNGQIAHMWTGGSPNIDTIAEFKRKVIANNKNKGRKAPIGWSWGWNGYNLITGQSLEKR